MRQFRPANRKIRQVEIEDGLALAGDQRHGLTAKSRKAFGQSLLIGERADNAETIFSGNISCCEDSGNAGTDLRPSVQIAKSELRIVWRANTSTCEASAGKESPPNFRSRPSASIGREASTARTRQIPRSKIWPSIWYSARCPHPPRRRGEGAKAPLRQKLADRGASRHLTV
jgi:hypothetical protein